MNKNKKLTNLIMALDHELSFRYSETTQLKDGTIRLDLHVNHITHKKPCPHCNSKKIKKYGVKKGALAHHIPLGNRKPTCIVYNRQRFKCNACGGTFFEDINWIHNNSRLTKNLFAQITSDLCTLITKNTIARVNCVSSHYVDYVVDCLQPPSPSHLPEVICLDETLSEVSEMLDEKTSWIKFVTNFSNGETGELLDILPFRTKRKLSSYFNNNFSYEERCKVKHLCCDGANHYIDLAGKCFPNADVCLDNFHVTKWLHKGFFNVRTKQQNHLLSKSKERNDFYFKEYTDLKRLSHKFITSANNQNKYWNEKYNKYANRIKHHISICPELKDAYAMLQYYYEIFHGNYSYSDKIKFLDTWIAVFENSTSDAIAATVKSISNHLGYIHNAWKHGYSNAVCEGNNNLIQTIKDSSFGIHCFDYFRTKSLLVVGRPSVARTFKQKHKQTPDYRSFFYEEFPKLNDYVLAYDITNPMKDFSLEGA